MISLVILYVYTVEYEYSLLASPNLYSDSNTRAQILKPEDKSKKGGGSGRPTTPPRGNTAKAKGKMWRWMWLRLWANISSAHTRARLVHTLDVEDELQQPEPDREMLVEHHYISIISMIITLFYSLWSILLCVRSHRIALHHRSKRCAPHASGSRRVLSFELCRAPLSTPIRILDIII